MQKIPIVYLALFVAALTFGSTWADPTSYPGKDCSSGGDATCEKATTGLVCESATKCNCENSRTFYYGSINKCVLGVEAPCDGSTPSGDLTPHGICNGSIVECELEFSTTATKGCEILATKECKNNNDCDEDNFQVCDVSGSKKCRCAADSEANVQKVCQLKAGSNCKASSPFPVPACQDQANCNSGGKCECNPGLVENSNKHCIVAYGGDCSKGVATPCDETLEYSACHTGQKKCLCIGEGINTVYQGGKCVLGADVPCETEPGARSCGAKSTCDAINKTCTCEKGKVRGGNLECVIPHDLPCKGGSSDGCDKAGHMKCAAGDGLDGLCACEDITNMIHKDGSCQFRADKECKVGSGPKCVANAICTPDEDATTATCKCAEGLTSINGECFGEFNTPCGGVGDSECNADNFLSCNSETKKCECAQSAGSEARHNGKKCELLHGSICNVGEDQQQCSTQGGISCIASDGSATATCQCKAPVGDVDQGLEPTDDKTKCFAAADKPCDSLDSNLESCNTEKFFECVGKKCACKAGSSLDASDKTCKLLADSECDIPAGSQPCFGKSACKTEDAGSTKGTCACNDNYVKNTQSLCKLKGGEACLGENDECNSELFQKCNATKGAGVCMCPEGSKLNSKTNLCILSAEKECTANDLTKPTCDTTFSSCKEGKCACNENLVLDGDTCSLAYQAPCKPEDDIGCSGTKNLFCGKDLKCVCKSKYTYNSTQKACFGDHEAPCEEAKDCDKEGHFACTSKKCLCEGDLEWNVDEQTCGASTFTLSIAMILIALISFFAKNN